VICRQVAEVNPQYHPSSGVATPRSYFLVFENDGDEDVFDAEWDWVIGEGEPPVLGNNPFPLESLRRAEKVRLPVFHTIGSAAELRVCTRWRDGRGERNEETWPLSL
jgi:hypothetical protein